MAATLLVDPVVETADVEATSEDLYAAVDAAADKLGAKLRKHHEKHCDRH